MIGFGFDVELLYLAQNAPANGRRDSGALESLRGEQDSRRAR